MEKKLNKIGRDINKFLNNFLKKQKRTELITSMNYGLFPGGKKIRSKIIIDVGKIFFCSLSPFSTSWGGRRMYSCIFTNTWMICHVWIMMI